MRPDIAEQKKRDKEFLAWLRLQPSCIDGSFSEFVHGQGRCIAAHVRSASNSGTSFKPLLCAVPLTERQHSAQHRVGERSMLELFLGRSFTTQEAHEWFKDKVHFYVEKWEKSLG